MRKIVTKANIRSIKIVGLAFLFCISSTQAVFAEGFAAPPPLTNKEKAARDISFTGGTNGGGTNSSCVTVGNDLGVGENPELAFRFFINKGFSEKQAAGIIGNFMVESGVNPKRVQGEGVIESTTLPSTGGYGIAQWDDRKKALASFATSQKQPLYSLGLQLDFVMFELNGTEKNAYEAFLKTTTIKDATTVWMTEYERPGKPALSDRIAAANKAFGDFSGAVTSPEPLAPTTTTACTGSGDIVTIALAELAKNVLEQPIGCDAGNPSKPGDCGPEVNKYTDNTLEYWCADFVSWVYKQSGSPFTGGASGGWRIASVEGVQAYMEEKGVFYKNVSGTPDPRPGDVYVINNGEHIGIVVKVEGKDLHVVSGNTSTDNYSNGVGVGDTVYKNFRSNASITGWGGL